MKNENDGVTVAFVYKWVHVPSMRWYVGSRTANGCNPNDGYICSSKTVKPMIQNDPHNWTRTVLETGSPEEMLELETTILTTLDAKNDPRSFNMHNGDGKFTTLGKPVSEETRAKISAAGKGRIASDEARAKMLGRPCSEHTRAKRSASLRGRKLSPEHIAKNRAAKTGVKQSPESVAKRTKIVVATNLLSGETFELKGHTEIELAGFNKGNVSLCANGKQSCHKGHTFKFKDSSHPKTT